jgi:arylsulfatase A-like enzyme
LLAGSAAALFGRAAAAERPPNVLLILADDLGYGDLSSFGARDLETPNIDGLVRSGVRFGNFYANSPVCSPTRAALLSGRFSDCAGVPGVIRTDPRNSWGYLSESAQLLPGRLKPAGYESAIIGKWHLGLELPNVPNLRGFQYFHGFLGDMMDDYYTHRRHGINYIRLDDVEIDPKGHATDLFTGWAVEYLNKRPQTRRPFFLYLAYNAPHVPVQPPAEWLERVRQRHPRMDEKRARLAALIEHLDSGIGRVLDALKASGQSENTLIIFTSDNGGQLSAGANCGSLRGGKQDMYEGGIRVPMCAAWPGKIQAGARSDRVAMAMDLYATICEAAGVAAPDDIDGTSILEDFTGARSGPAPDRDLVWVRREGGHPYEGRDYYAIRRGDWKLLQNTPFERYQLFNLAKDPAETKDVADSEPAVFRELIAALSQHIQKAGQTPWQSPAG